MVTDQLADGYDVVVIGGGAAGLNGALMLARSRRRVVVIDSGAPRNAPAAAVHGLLARDGTPPARLLETGRAEVRGYGGHVVAGEVDAVARDGGEFVVRLAGGVWVAGNITDLSAQVGTAAAAGALAGAMINADLVAEETRDAVAASRQAVTGAA
jgi:glycine/D-amino acid oxidase-like deaminating enzyme